MHLGDPPPPGPVAYEMEDHRERSRHLAVESGPVEPCGRAQRLQTGRYSRGRVGVDGVLTELNHVFVQVSWGSASFPSCPVNNVPEGI